MKARESIAFALGLIIAPAACAEPPVTVLHEIHYLIRYIGGSGCAFERNGIWSNAEAAQSHVRAKYDFLMKLGMIDTTKDFIDKAATESSLSGHPYEVRCGDDLPMSSNRWLNNELVRYRASRRARSTPIERLR